MSEHLKALWVNEEKYPDFIFLDLETTGGKHERERITEIGLIEVSDGEVLNVWQSLVNPQKSIPPWITRLTGISNQMVASAPVFEDLAESLLEKLKNKVLVAHNARFDFSFLKSEFKRLGISWSTPTLCTVKLSRALFPEEKRHGLDQIIERFNIPCDARHRALDDAKVLVSFFEQLPNRHRVEDIWQSIHQQLKQPSLPANLPSNALQDCPDLPGVYRFYGESGQVLYVGKSIHLRSRILSHFNSDHRRSKAMLMSHEIFDLDWTLCSGDLGAQLLEAQEIKRLSPKFNVKLRKLTKLWSLTKQLDGNGYETLAIKNLNEVYAHQLGELYGLFRSKKQAEKALEKLASDHGLCHRLTGLEKKPKGPCFAFQVKKCRGACVAKETPEIYNIRQNMALQPMNEKAWPWQGPVAIKEIHADVEEDEIHLVNHWCWLGSVQNHADLQDLLEMNQTEFVIELDQYRILSQFLLKPSKSIEITPLNKK